MKREVQRLRSLPGDDIQAKADVGPARSLFEEAQEQGFFWDVPETRQYMKYRHALLQCFLDINTAEAAEAAWLHCRGLLWLHPPDDIGVRDIFIPLHIRLGLVQEGYDMLRKWAEEWSSPDYDWRDPRASTMLIEANRDILEQVNPFLGQDVNLSLKVAATLIKIKVLLEIKCLRGVAILSKRLPEELVHCVRRELVSRTILQRKDIMYSGCYDFFITKLELHIKTLYDAIEKVSPKLWPQLLKSREYIPQYIPGAEPPGYCRHDSEEVQLVVRYNYLSWKETPGAFEVIKELAENVDAS